MIGQSHNRSAKAVHPMAEIADVLVPDPKSRLGQGVDPYSAVRSFVTSFDGLSLQRIIETLIDIASRNPGMAQQALLAWGSDRRLTGDLDLRGLNWVGRLPEGLIVLGNLWLDGVGSVRDWVGGDGTRQWKESQITIMPQGVRVGHPRRQGHTVNRVEGTERRGKDEGPQVPFHS